MRAGLGVDSVALVATRDGGIQLPAAETAAPSGGGGSGGSSAGAIAGGIIGGIAAGLLLILRAHSRIFRYRDAHTYLVSMSAVSRNRLQTRPSCCSHHLSILTLGLLL